MYLGNVKQTNKTLSLLVLFRNMSNGIFHRMFLPSNIAQVLIMESR